MPVINTMFPRNFVEAWLFTILGILCCSFGMAVLMTVGVVKNPLEELVMVIAQKNNTSFSRYRIMADSLCILLNLMMILTFNLAFPTLREGT